MKQISANITGSLIVNGTDVTETLVSSNTWSGSLSSRVTNLESFSSSINEYTASNNSRLNSIESLTGSYATTGSNQFSGSQTITGSLVVTSQVIAQTLNVQQVTSSIVYSSGSNIFGNNIGNTHQFTGSVAVTGSVSVNGDLNGTRATFSNSLNASSLVINGASPQYHNVAIKSNGTFTYQGLGVYASSNDRFVVLQHTGTEAFIDVENGGSGVFTPLSFRTGGSTRLTISTTGEATFTNSVTAGTTLKVTSADTLGTNVNIINTSTGGYNWNIFSGGSDATLAPVGSLIFRDSTNGVTRMVISTGGNVGIGTTAPSSPLHVRTSTLRYGVRSDIILSGVTNNYLILNSQNANYGVMGAVSATGALNGDVFGVGYTASAGTSFTPVINWTSTSRVGINTTSPNATFQVNGTTNTSILTLSPSYHGMKILTSDIVSTFTIDLVAEFPQMALIIGNSWGVIGRMNILRGSTSETLMFSISRTASGTWGTGVIGLSSNANGTTITSITGSGSTISINGSAAAYMTVELTAMIR